MTCCPPRPLTVRYQRVAASIGVGPAGPQGPDGPAGPAGSARAYAPIAVAAVANLPLSGLAPIQGVTPADGELVGAFGQTDGTQGGVYAAHSGAWTRDTGFDASGDLSTGMGGLILGGDYAQGTWTLVTETPIVLGTDALSFKVEPFLDVLGQDGKVVTVASGVPVLAKVGNTHITNDTLEPGKLAAGGSGNNGKVVGVVAGLMALMTAPGSVLQTALSTALAVQPATRFIGAFLAPDAANSRNAVDLDRADVREYGANVGGVQRTTATFTAGVAAGTLANAKNYVNGNWLMLSGLGAAHGMATPGAPTLAVQGTTGASTVSVKVVALTSTGGYTPASVATTVTTANATLSKTNFVEVWFPPIASAYRYLVYVQFGGSGSYTYFGGVIAHPQYDAIGLIEAMTFRITSATPPAAQPWLPSTAPASGRANGLRTQILTGGGTTAVTVFPVPVTSGAAVDCVGCSLIPLEDAIKSGDVGYSGEVRIPRTTGGGVHITGPLQVRRPVWIHGANCGGTQANSILNFRDGCGLSVYSQTNADQWQPGTLYRLGDRVESQLRTGVVGCWTLTAIAAGATWGVSGVTEPTWNYTVGGTTSDNGHTWTFIVVESSGSGATFEKLKCTWEGGTIPAHRVNAEDDLRYGARNLAGNGGTAGLWSAGAVIPAGTYIVPTAANVTGKMYFTVAGGTTHATTEPTWPKVNGASVVDNSVTWVCFDVLRRQGVGFYFATVAHMDHVGVFGCGGTGIFGDGTSYATGSAINRSRFREIVVGQQVRGHGIVVQGSDGSTCTFSDVTIKIMSDGGCSIQDNSFYGNTFTNVLHDGGARYQNQCWSASVQQHSALMFCYVEGGVGAETDWNKPGKIVGGAHAAGYRTGSNARRIGVPHPVNFGNSIDYGLVEYDDTGITHTRYLSLGNEYRAMGTGTSAAGTLLDERLEERLSEGRSRQTVRGSISVEETSHFDARGAGKVFPAELRTGVGPNILSESRYASSFAVPTKGLFAPGDYYSWNADSRRIAFKPQRWGGLGATARANSTAYAVGDIVSTGGLHFGCVNAGTSAGSLPAAYAATTAPGDFVTDGTARFQRWFTAQDPQLVAIPNLWADPVAMASDADQTIQIFSGFVGQSCRTMFALTRNQVITLGTTGIMPGDCFKLMQKNSVAFTITISTVDGGSVVMPALTKCWVVIRYSLAGTFEQVDAGTYL